MVAVCACALAANRARASRASENLLPKNFRLAVFKVWGIICRFILIRLLLLRSVDGRFLTRRAGASSPSHHCLVEVCGLTRGGGVLRASCFVLRASVVSCRRRGDRASARGGKYVRREKLFSDDERDRLASL